MPPNRGVNRTPAEDSLGAIVEIAIEHGPTHIFIEFLAAYFRGVCGFDLLPGFFHDRLVISNGFFVAEALHFFADAADE